MNIKLKIIGNGPWEKTLKHKIQKEGIANVILINRLPFDELIREINKCLFVIVPSLWHEIFGLTIIESFMCGKTVLASRRGGILEIVEEGKNGLTFNPGDSQDLKDKIIYLMNNPALVAQMGENGRFWVERELSEDKIYKSLIGVYSTLLGCRVN